MESVEGGSPQKTNTNISHLNGFSNCDLYALKDTSNITIPILNYTHRSTSHTPIFQIEDWEWHSVVCFLKQPCKIPNAPFALKPRNWHDTSAGISDHERPLPTSKASQKPQPNTFKQIIWLQFFTSTNANHICSNSFFSHLLPPFAKKHPRNHSGPWVSSASRSCGQSACAWSKNQRSS